MPSCAGLGLDVHRPGGRFGFKRGGPHRCRQIVSTSLEVEAESESQITHISSARGSTTAKPEE